MSSLLVLLPSTTVTSQTELDYYVTPDTRVITKHATAPLALLPAPSGTGSEVIAIVPADMLSWHRVELPKGTGPRSPRLRAVLDGLLEDRLLDETDQLHFALEPRAAAGATAWVAACDRAWLRAAVQSLEAAGRRPSRIVPEFAPEGVTTLFAVGEADHARLIAAGSDGVFTVPLNSGSLALLPRFEDDTPCLAEPPVAAAAEQVLQRSPVLQQPGSRLLSATQTRWDLAQLEFASTGRTRAWKKASTRWIEFLRAPHWRPARWGAVLLVAVQLLGLNAWAWKERGALASKREAARSILTQTFPQVRAVVDAPVQMEREVAALRQRAGGTSGRDLETMLGVVAAAAPAGRTVSSMEFSGTELRLRGLAGNEAEAQPLLKALRSQGYAVVVQGDALVLRAEAP
jgi:general secretion pathway protein L